MLIKQEHQLVNYASPLSRCIKQEDDGMCKICGNAHDGYHFGVFSCRACKYNIFLMKLWANVFILYN